MSSRQHLGAVHCELAWVRYKHHPHGRQSRIVMEFSPLTFQYPPTPPAHLISPPSIPSLNPCISATSRHADQNPSQNPSRKHCPRDGKQHRDDQQHQTGRPDDIPDQTRPDEHRHRQKKTLIVPSVSSLLTSSFPDMKLAQATETPAPIPWNNAKTRRRDVSFSLHS